MDFRYRGAEEKTRQAFRDGFFTAGDLGYLDADGYLYIADRRTDLIITGGANVYPAEVESVHRRSIPQVADVAVIGVPDAEMGKSVLAVVELRAGERATAEELIAFARRDLAHYKCPRRVEFVDRAAARAAGQGAQARAGGALRIAATCRSRVASARSTARRYQSTAAAAPIDAT